MKLLSGGVGVGWGGGGGGFSEIGRLFQMPKFPTLFQSFNSSFRLNVLFFYSLYPICG